MLLLLLLWLSLQLTVVQTFLAQKTTDYLEKELGAKIEIALLKVDFFNQVELQKLYIEDKTQDTLLHLKSLRVSLDAFDRKSKRIKLSLKLDSCLLNLYKTETDSFYNHQFVIDYFIRPQDDSDSSKWSFAINALALKEVNFRLHNHQKQDTAWGINYNHLDVSNLNLQASEIEFLNNGLEAKVDSLSLKEENGFNLVNLATEFSMTDKYLTFDSLSLKANQSQLNGYLKLSADSFADYSQFIELVDLSAQLDRTTIKTKDLALFVPSLRYLDESLKLSGSVRGTIANLSCEELALDLNDQTYLKGDFKLRGLPNLEETFIYLDLNEFATTAAGLRAIPYPPFEEQNHLEVPENVDQLGIISFQGNFTGYYDDFVAYGQLQTQLGQIATDLQVVQNRQNNFSYKGSLTSSYFDLGRFFQIEQLGGMALDLAVAGEGIEKDNIKAKAKGTISKLEYANYQYQDIQLDGEISTNQYLGKIYIEDPNLELDFEGGILKKSDVADADFKLDLRRCMLKQLGLVNSKDSTANLRLNALIDLDFTSLDELNGTMEIDSLFYQDQVVNVKNKQLMLKAENLKEQKHLSLQSSFLEADLSGQYSFKDMADSYRSFFSYYFKEEEAKQQQVAQDFSLKASFKKSTALITALVPGLEIDSGLQFETSLNTLKQTAALKVKGPKVTYLGNTIQKFDLDFETNADSAFYKLKANQLILGKVNRLDTLQWSASLKNSQLLSNLEWNGSEQTLDRGKLALEGEWNQYNEIDLQFLNSFISIGDSLWELKNGNTLKLHRDTLTVQNMEFANVDQNLGFDGRLSKDPKDSLSVSLQDFQLSYLNFLMPEHSTKLKGLTNGQLYVKDPYQEFSLMADIRIDGLSINKVKIGNSAFKSIWNADRKELDVKGHLGEGMEEKLTIKGIYSPKLSNDQLDMQLNFSDFPIAIVSPYLEDYLTDISGQIQGIIKVDGKLNHPLLNGDLMLEKAGMTVDYLKTHYTINDELLVRPDFIGFDLIEIVDPNGQKAIATGTIFHQNYSNFNLDIGLEYQNFTALSTKSKDNELFYGKAICSGTANISGYADQLIMNINATAKKGTDFNIPLTDQAEVSSSDFLVFTNSPKEDREKIEAIDLSGIQMNFDLDIEDEAKLKIIFDEQIGDVLEAKGSGNLKLQINTLGNFNIYGQYIIDEGNYLFTLKNVISKRFQLANGSRIAWDGNPYRAKIDLRAIYNLRAPLADLMPEDSTSNLRRRSQVELELHMTSFLMSPEVAFDIRLPNATEEIKQRLRSILYVNQNTVNEQEMNQQVFGLLFLNRFIPPQSGTAVASGRGSPGINNGYEMLSNQMSNWLSKVSDQFDVGVNYRQGNQYTGDEFDLSLSTELFSDRLILDGNFGYAQNNVIQDDNQSNFIGEFTVEYKLSRDGRLRVSGFNRSVNNNLLQTVSPYTQGVGLFYREEFDSLDELWRRYFGQAKKQSD